MARDELVADVKRAVEVAREALEQDAEEARTRGRGSLSPDTASVGMLAAGILVANAIQNEAQVRALEAEAPRVGRAHTSRSAA